MRKLPPAIISPSISQKASSLQSSTTNIDLEKYKREAGVLSLSSSLDVDIRNHLSMDVDIRIPPVNAASWPADIRNLNDSDSKQGGEKTTSKSTTEGTFWDLQCTKFIYLFFHITDNSDTRSDLPNLPPNLPKTQRDLFLRIHAQQKETNVEADENKTGFKIDDNINWYSDDDDEDDDRLTIKVDGEDVKEKEDENQPTPR